MNYTKKDSLTDNTCVDSAHISKEEGITFSVADNDTLEIKGNGKLDEQAYSFASYFISKDEWKKIRRIVIKDGITELDFSYYLSDHQGIREIEIADSVKRIGDFCFRDMFQLTTVDMGNGVEEIGAYSFGSCLRLSKIKFSDSLTTLGEGAFKECEALQQLDLPESLIEIGKNCFSACSGLRQIILPDSVRVVRAGAFDECYDLEEMVLSASLDKWAKPQWNTSALKKIINRSAHIWKLGSVRGKKIWYVNGKKTEKIQTGETAVAKGKRYSIDYRLQGGRLVGEMPETYEYGEICRIPATVAKEGYFCTGWCDEKHRVCMFYPDAMYLGKYDSGNLVLTPLLIQYRVECAPRRGIKITLWDRGLPIVQEYYEIRYSEQEDMTGAKTKIMDGKSMVLGNLTEGKRYYVEFRWGSNEGNEGEREPLSPWMGKKSVSVSCAKVRKAQNGGRAQHAF